MGQVTIYLDEESERRLKAAAASAGVPVSRWVAGLIRNKTRTEWPESVKALAGQWPDLPEPEALRRDRAADAERESL